MRRTGRLADLGQPEAATLAREYFLAGHMIDRAGMPHVIGALGRDAMTQVAIEEWSGASPIYARRMQRAMGFVGDTVETIFKGMQLDVGAPPEFLDFRYEVIDEHHGRFHLDHCGALADVEPMGAEYVTAMCHHIEDPTFDATAAATNPRARMRPVHRPPRIPADRQPVCEWTVDIDASRDPIPYPEAAERLAHTAAALCAIEPPVRHAAPTAPAPDEGMIDYSGPFDPDLRFEDFALAALDVVCAEAALQGHLLAMAFAQAVQQRTTPADALEMLGRQLVGVAGLTSTRLAKALDVGSGLEGVADILERHPLFAPRGYVEATLVLSADALVVELRPCPAADESVPSWIGLLVDDGVAAIGAIAEAVEPLAVVRRIDTPGAVAAWEITLGESPAAERDEVSLTAISTGSEFVFTRIGRRHA